MNTSQQPTKRQRSQRQDSDPTDRSDTRQSGTAERAGPLAIGHVESPIGRIGVVADDEAILTILFDPDGELSDDTTHNPAGSRYDVGSVTAVDAASHPVLGRALAQLDEYFRGERYEFDLPLAPDGTAFQRAAWTALRTIPFGETVSYGQQAERMGDKNKARAVGAANGKNPIPIVIPCHRVVGADGSLTGFAGGVSVKAWLLEHEGVRPAQAQTTLDV